MKIFNLGDNYNVVCSSENTRYGFRHLASLCKNSNNIAGAKICYYNRTWESYEFESVILRVLENHFKGADLKKYQDTVRGENSHYGALLV